MISCWFDQQRHCRQRVAVFLGCSSDWAAAEERLLLVGRRKFVDLCSALPNMEFAVWFCSATNSASAAKLARFPVSHSITLDLSTHSSRRKAGSFFTTFSITSMESMFDAWLKFRSEVRHEREQPRYSSGSFGFTSWGTSFKYCLQHCAITWFWPKSSNSVFQAKRWPSLESLEV